MRLIPLQSLSGEDLRAWDRLSQRAAEPNPFFERPFVLAAARAFAATGVFLLVVEGDGAGCWGGCLPVVPRRILRRPLLLSAWQHPYSFLGTPLVDSELTEEFAEALVRGVGAPWPGRLLTLQRCADGPVLAAIEAAAIASPRTRVFAERRSERAALERRPEPTYLDGLSPHHRREYGRLRRRLGEELGAEVTVHDRSDSPAAVGEFLRLEASGWKGREGTAMTASGDAELFRRLCEEFASQGRLQMLSLEAGGRVAAMKCNLKAGDALFGFKIAFDEELRRFSPGIQLEVENVDVFHQRSELLTDSCATPTNEMINRLWPDRRTIVKLILGPGGATGWFGNRLLDTAYAIRTRRTAPSTPS
jgi:CelD/BcsL family acetyltransferase involved in cellulose biosynthesis